MRQRLLALALAGALILAGTTLVSASTGYTNVTSYATSFVGYRYASMGDTPGTGFSCTGFVHWVYSHFGYSTPEDVYALSGSYTHVSPGAMMPGDVLIFANTFHPGLSHAAIYLGNGMMVGADNFAVGVRIDSVWDAYWGPRFVTALRVTPYGQPSQNVQGFSYTRPTPAASGVRAHIYGLSVHSGPGYGYYTVGTLAYGTPLRVIARAWGWVKVASTDGVYGWASSRYVW